MTRDNHPREATPESLLRQQAEARLRASSNGIPATTTDDVEDLVYELQVRQIELEIQNEELRRNERGLSEARNRYFELYELAPVAYLTLDRQGVVREANVKATSILQCERSQLVGRPLSKFVARDWQATFSRHWHEALESATPSRCELTLLRQAVAGFHAQLDIAADTSNNSTATAARAEVRVTFADISDHKEAEISSRERNATLRKQVAQQTRETKLLAEAVAHLGEGVLITGDGLDWPGPRIVFVNEAMCRISGYTSAELIGKTPRVLQGEKTDRRVLTRIKRQLLRGESAEAELINYRQDGTQYEADVFISPVYDALGKRINFVSVHRDVTERNQAKRRELGLARVLEESVNEIYVFAADTWQYAQANRGGRDNLGYFIEELQEITPLEVSPEFDRDSFAKLLEPLLTHAQESIQYETCHQRKDGTTYPVEVHLQLAYMGLSKAFVAVVLDITQRKKAEQNLRTSEAFGRSILNSLSAHIAVLDCDGKIITVNAAWSEFARQNGEPELRRTGVNNNYLDVCRSAQLDGVAPARTVADALEDILAGSRTGFSCEYSCNSPQEQRWFGMSATRLVGDVPGAVIAHENITARKLAEIALQRERDFSEELIDSARCVILLLDKRGRIIRCNKYFKDMTGYTSAELARRDWFALCRPPREQDRARELFQRALTGVRTVANLSTVLTKNGREREIDWYDTPLHGQDASLVGLLCTGQDVTERRILEREVLEISGEEKRRIGYDLHDGLCQELTGLGMLAQGLADQLASGISGQSLEIGRLQECYAAARKLSDGIGQTTGRARDLSHGLVPVDVDAQGLMSALQELASSTDDLHHVSCSFEMDHPIEFSDNFAATHLYRIAQEAVGNALKHSGAKHINISLGENDLYVILKVTDDGTGIPEGARRHGKRMGLRIMQYRADQIGALLDLGPGQNGGTSVTCLVARERNSGKDQ